MSVQVYRWLAVAVMMVVLGGQAAPQETKASRQAELEKTFKEMLDGVVLRGTWQMTQGEGLKGKAPMTPARPDRYVIKNVSKGLDDNWVVTARIQYGDKDVVLPISVRVVWAGDTPVITLDKVKMPLLGTYSARVMIYNGFYAGTWFGDGYGGVLSGHIIKAADENKIKKLEKQAEEKQDAQNQSKCKDSGIGQG
jgi:hypothetical protein